MRSMLVLLIALVAAVAAAEVPDSIVGKWRLDLGRTMTEHIDRMAQARPDVLAIEEVKQAKAAFAAGPELASPLTMTITEDEIISQGTEAAPTVTPYTVVGGNSALVIVEFTDEAGHKGVSNIRLIEGGIAVEPIDCRVSPGLCERQRQRALEHQSSTSADQAGADGASMALSSSAADGQSNPVGSQTADHLSQPRWFYFRPAE